MDGKEVMLAGFAHEIRDRGGIAFLVLRDREGMAQITLVKKLLGKDVFKMARSISRESVVMVRGNVKAEAKAPRGYEILPTEIQVLSAAQVPLPLDPTEKVEYELTPALTPGSWTSAGPASWLHSRSRVQSFAASDYFHKKGMVEVFTPRSWRSHRGGTISFPSATLRRRPS